MLAISFCHYNHRSEWCCAELAAWATAVAARLVGKVAARLHRRRCLN